MSGRFEGPTKHLCWSMGLGSSSMPNSQGYEVVGIVDCKALAEVTVDDASASKVSFVWFLCHRAGGCHLGMMIMILFKSTATALILQTLVIQRWLFFKEKRQYFNMGVLYPALNKQKPHDLAVPGEFSCKFSSGFFWAWFGELSPGDHILLLELSSPEPSVSGIHNSFPPYRFCVKYQDNSRGTALFQWTWIIVFNSYNKLLF